MPSYRAFAVSNRPPPPHTHTLRRPPGCGSWPAAPAPWPASPARGTGTSAPAAPRWTCRLRGKGERGRERETKRVQRRESRLGRSRSIYVHHSFVLLCVLCPQWLVPPCTEGSRYGLMRYATRRVLHRQSSGQPMLQVAGSGPAHKPCSCCAPNHRPRPRPRLRPRHHRSLPPPHLGPRASAGPSEPAAERDHGAWWLEN